MSDKEIEEIAYDLGLEEQLEEIKLKIWFTTELQIQPTNFHSEILESFLKITKNH